MIERLTTNLGALARMSPAELATEQGSRVAADCADAIRLELDCPQQDLTSDQRELLSALGDLLDTLPHDERVVRVALAACRALGVRKPQA
jgi:hypothetical protein